MALKNLIENQIIIIDDHKRGAGEIKDFDNLENDIHIDKETNYKIFNFSLQNRLNAFFFDKKH